MYCKKVQIVLNVYLKEEVIGGNNEGRGGAGNNKKLA